MSLKHTDHTKYLSIVGHYLNFFTNTSPNILLIISCVNWYIIVPQQAHMEATKRILQYVKETID
jgi:hypothetical protein